METNSTLLDTSTSLFNESLTASSVDDWENESFFFLIRTIVTVVWSVIIVIGVSANACVLFVTFFLSTNLTPTQYFIINLSISDLLFLLCCPTLLLVNYHGLINYDRMSTIFAKIICKLDFFSTHVSVCQLIYFFIFK
jgi:hypothetical protein